MHTLRVPAIKLSVDKVHITIKGLSEETGFDSSIILKVLKEEI